VGQLSSLQACVPHPVEVIGMAVKDHAPLVAALVAVVFIMQRRLANFTFLS
jgi:hypothetical protein